MARRRLREPANGSETLRYPKSMARTAIASATHSAASGSRVPPGSGDPLPTALAPPPADPSASAWALAAPPLITARHASLVSAVTTARAVRTIGMVGTVCKGPRPGYTWHVTKRRHSRLRPHTPRTWGLLLKGGLVDSVALDVRVAPVEDALVEDAIRRCFHASTRRLALALSGFRSGVITATAWEVTAVASSPAEDGPARLPGRSGTACAGAGVGTDAGTGAGAGAADASLAVSATTTL